MRMPRPLAAVVMILLVPQLTGCSKYETAARPFHPAPTAENHDTRYRVFLEDGRALEMMGLWEDSTVVGGYDVDAKATITLEKERVTRVLEKGDRPVASLFLAMTGVGVVALIIGMATWDGPFGGL